MPRLSDRATTLLLATGAFLFFLVNYAVFGTLNQYEFCAYGEIAGNVLDGEGFRTRLGQIAALAVAVDSGFEGPPWPVTDRFVGYVMFVALVQGILGASDFTLTLTNGLCYVALVVITWRAGVTYFGRPTAALATAIFALHPYFALNYTLSGFADPFFAVMTWCFVLLLLRLPEAERPGRLALATGAVGGLALLARYNFVLWLPIVLVFLLLFRSTRKPSVIGLCAAGGALVVAPFVVWNLATWGVPNTYLASTWNMAADLVHPYETWRYFEVYDTSALVAEHWDRMLVKFSNYTITMALSETVKLFKLQLLIPFAVAAAFLAGGRRRKRLVLLFAAMFVLQLVAFSALRLELGSPPIWADRYFFWAALPVVWLASYGLLRLTRKLRLRVAVITAVLGLSAVVLLPEVRPRPYLDPDTFYAGTYLREEIPRDALMLSNASFFISHYYEKTALDLPAELFVVADIQRAYPLQYVFLDLFEYDFPMYRQWYAEMDRDQLRRFAAVHGMVVEEVFVGPDGLIQGILLRVE